MKKSPAGTRLPGFFYEPESRQAALRHHFFQQQPAPQL